MKNERTSRKVASIAGKVLRCLAGRHGSWPVFWGRDSDGLNPPEDWVSVAELKALAASALTQSPDKPAPKGLAISDIRAWDRALTEKERQAEYRKAARTKGPQPGETVRTVKARKK